MVYNRDAISSASKEKNVGPYTWLSWPTGEFLYHGYDQEYHQSTGNAIRQSAAE